MSHHLAALICQAETDKVSVAERLEIMRLIIDLSGHRRDLTHHPLADPFEELQRTMLALTRDSAWPDAHHNYVYDDDPDPSPIPVQDRVSAPGNTDDSADNTDAPVEVSNEAIAAEASDFTKLLDLTRSVEATTQEARLRLLWLAAEQARAFDSDWIQVADRVKTTIESRTVSSLRRHADLRRRLRLRAVADDGETVEVADDAAEEARDAEETESLLADTTLAVDLRRCAADLLAVADVLEERSATTC